MTSSIQLVLLFLALVLAVIGISLICKAYATKPSVRGHPREKRIIQIGIWGIVFLFLSGLIIIYFYSVEPISERIIKEKDKVELPDLGLRG